MINVTKNIKGLNIKNNNTFVLLLITFLKNVFEGIKMLMVLF